MRPSLSKRMRPRVTIVKKSPMAVFNALVASMKAVEGSLEVSGHFSHFYPEGACLYITFAGLPQDPFHYYEDTWTAAMQATLRHNGSISHHHGIGFWRRPFMGSELGPAGLDLLRSIRRAVDPNGILNRGKLVEYDG